jgi:hypothetical protein
VENAEKYARAKSGHKISAQKAEREEPFEVNLKNEKRVTTVTKNEAH